MSEVFIDEDDQARPDEAQNDLIAKLSSYAVVNSSWNVLLGGYNAAKNYSPVLKAGFEKAEAAGHYVYSTAEPVVRPVVVSLNEKYSLDEKGIQVLDKVEHAVEGIMNVAVDAKAKTTHVITESKQAATNALETGKGVAQAKTQALIERGNTPLNHFLDLAEIVVDKILPPSIQSQSESGNPESSFDEEQQVVASPLSRASALGLDVTKRVKQAAAARLPTITMRTPTEIAEMTHVIDLIQYAAQFVENEKARLGAAVEATQARLNDVKQVAQARVNEAKELTQTRVNEAREMVAEKIHPLRALIESQTVDLHDSATRSVVSLVASVAHASEVLRRRIGAKHSEIIEHMNGDKRREQLQKRLSEVVQQAKRYVQTLSEAQLRDYVTTVRDQSGAAIAALLNVFNQATSTTLAGGLLSWTNSLAARLGYQVVPVTDLKAALSFAAPGEDLSSSEAASEADVLSEVDDVPQLAPNSQPAQHAEIDDKVDDGQADEEATNEPIDASQEVTSDPVEVDEKPASNPVDAESTPIDE